MSIIYLTFSDHCFIFKYYATRFAHLVITYTNAFSQFYYIALYKQRPP